MRAVAIMWLPFCFASVASGEEFYVLQGIDKTQPDDVITTPGIDGFTIRVSWNKIHQEGFGWLNDQIARGAELNTSIQLRIMTGAHAPQNLPGVSYFEYLSTDEAGIETLRRAPVPWDAAMHMHWQALASELAARFGDNDRIKVVHVPSFANSSELHMPDEVTLLSGYSSRTLAESWVGLAEPLAAAFSEAIISLNYATPSQAQINGQDSEWLLDELAAISDGRAGYQANDLAADVSLDRNKYQTLIAQSELGRSIGFQMVSSSDTERFGGDFLEAVAIGFEAGAEWLEIYAADVDRIPRPGDYNLDGSVSAADFVLWRNSLGSGFSQSDYNVWRRHFGQTSGNGGSSFTVPEPETVAMLLIGLLAMWYRGRAATWR